MSESIYKTGTFGHELENALARIAVLENQLETSKANECEAASLYEGMLKQVDELRGKLDEALKNDWRYSHREIATSCGLEVALDIRAKVIAHRQRIRAAMNSRQKCGE